MSLPCRRLIAVVGALLLLCGPGGVLPALAAAPAPAAAKAAAVVPAKTPKAPKVMTVEVKGEMVGKGLERLSFAFPSPVAAAIFLRDGYLWTVFDHPGVVFHQQGVQLSPSGRLQSAENLPNGSLSIMRYRVRPGQTAVVFRSGGTWRVDLRDNGAPPASPIEAVIQADKDRGDNLFLPVTDLGSRNEIVDPAVGDRIVVVPVLGPGRGVSVRRDFVELNILATAQGIVIAPKIDGISISRYRNGLLISKPDGLALVRPKSDHRTRIRPEGPLDGASAAASAAPEQLKLIDAAAWRLGPPETYTHHYHQLLAKIVALKANDRNPARWDLARFFIGYGMAVDALGVMKLMVETNPDLMNDANFRAVRGVAHIMRHRYNEALDDLSQPELAASDDAALWRAIADEKLEKWDAALADYMKGSDVLSLYDQPERASFELAAVKAAYYKHNLEFMSRELGLMSEYDLPVSESSEVDYLKGRMYELAGDDSSAMTAYKKVIAAGNRQTSAEARFALTDLKLKTGLITVTDAIDRLERLRFSWRGDQFELDLLARLGQLYFKAGDHRMGFETLRQAVSYFSKSPKTLAISQEMTDVFRHLFLDGGADKMPPVTALALYYDFRELTPLGADGDEMIRRLADRLVSVDLLGRAADLLGYQVKYRLEGVARATVASKLAMIYIMDQKPKKALEVIRSTRQAVMPPDIENRRRRVEARALTDLKRYEEASVLIEPDKSHAADLLRDDIYWGGGRWKKVVSLGQKLLGERWKDAKPLDSDERRQVLRVALAMSMSDNKAGLVQMRHHYLKLMAGGSYENAFSLITSDQDQSSSDVRNMAHDIAGVDKLEAFMKSYRKEFDDKKPAAAAK